MFFPGFVTNPQAYMRRARVFALSSRNEGFPGALIEALEVGAAIVSTDCPFGPREALDGERFGRLVPVGDAERFAAALEAELEEPDVGPRRAPSGTSQLDAALRSRGDHGPLRRPGPRRHQRVRPLSAVSFTTRVRGCSGVSSGRNQRAQSTPLLWP